MKSFLKSILVLVVATASTLAFAQDQKPEKPKKSPQEKAESLTRKLDESLNLNDEQTAKVMKVNIQLMEEIAKYKTETGKKTAEAKIRIKEAREVAAQQLKSVLTEDQYKKYQQWEEERKNKKGHHDKGQGYNKPGQSSHSSTHSK